MRCIKQNETGHSRQLCTPLSARATVRWQETSSRGVWGWRCGEQWRSRKNGGLGVEGFSFCTVTVFPFVLLRR